MTLRERNRLITVFFGFSVATVIFYVFLFVVNAALHVTSPPPVNSAEAVLSAPSVSRFWFAAPYDFTAVLASIVFLTLSVPVVTMLMVIHFEKTQAQECLYFALFLLSCLTESTRLCIPILNLWEKNATMLITWTRVLFWGRFVAPAAFLFSAVFSLAYQNRDAERNALMIIAAAGIIATLVPVNVVTVLPTCIASIGFMSFFRTYRFCIFGFTVLALFVHTRNSSMEHRFILLGFVVLFSGYLLLINAASWLEVASGVLAFTGGVYLYLSNLHRTYL